MTRRRLAGLTMVELLVTLAVLGLVLALTSSGIVGALRVQRTQEELTNTQSKLRRVSEVLSQELRSAVMGAVGDYPVVAGDRGVSFALLAGDGGITVRDRPGSSWASSNNTYVHSSDPAALDALVGRPALLVNGDGQAMVVPEITHVPGSGDRVNHDGCKVSIPYVPDTRLYGARAVGYQYDPADRTLYQVELGPEGIDRVAFAFDLTSFEIAYQYESGDGTLVRADPWRDAAGEPQPSFEDSEGRTYRLARLRLTLGSAGTEGREREYVSFVELTGLGNERRPITELHPCDEPGGGSGDPGSGGEDPVDPPDPGEEPDDPPPGDEGCGKLGYWC